MKRSFALFGLITLMSACGVSTSSSGSSSGQLSDSTTSIVTSYFSYDSNTSYQSYTVTFVTNAPTTLDAVITSIIETMPIIENGSLTLEGWYFDASLTQAVNFPLFVDRDMTLYAKWIEASAGFIFKPTLTGNGYFAEAYVGNATTVTIQSTYNGKPILELGPYLFYNNATLLSVNLPTQLTTIGMAAFKNVTQLPSITIPNSVTEIRTDAFSGATALTSITMSTNLQVIGNNAFEKLPNLTSIDLPASLQDIHSRAFADASNLTQVIIRASTPPLRFANSFENTPVTLRYLVPSTSLNTYKTNSYWINYATQIIAI